MRTVVELLTSSLDFDKRKNKQNQNGTDEASERRGREKESTVDLMEAKKQALI